MSQIYNLFGCCCDNANVMAIVRVNSAPMWGFPPFHNGIDKTYTVGTGWSNTTITTGMIATRIDAGVITGVYEAKVSFTASADPSTDTLRWRHAGLTADIGFNLEDNFWWNCEPMFKLSAVGKFTVGSGWETLVTSFTAGDLVIEYHKDGFSANHDRWTFWRVKADCAIGNNRPSQTPDYFESYAGNRSLWLDYTPPATTAYSGSPYFHFTPVARYGGFKVTTDILIDNVSQATCVQEYTRNKITGAITVVTDEWVVNKSVAMPDPPPGEDISGVFPPSPLPGPGNWAQVDFHYHAPKVAGNFNLIRGVYPDSTCTLSYTRNDYADYSLGQNPWLGPPHYRKTTASASVNLSLTSLTLATESTVFEWTGTIPYYHEFDLCCYYQDTADPVVDFIASYIGKVANGTSGSFPPFGPFLNDGTNTVHNSDVKVTQTIELLSEVDHPTFVTDLIALLPDFPQYNYLRECSVNESATLSYSDLGNISFVEYYELLYANQKSQQQYVTTFGPWDDDWRFVENSVFLAKYKYKVNDNPHWTVTQIAGASEVETQYNSAPLEHTFAPTDDTVQVVKVVTTDPSP
jgi:hypothetical protein